jgi:SAM-dependent methyltransferase
MNTKGSFCVNIRDIIKNELIQDDSSVWVLKQHCEFGYSDGVESENYLEHVFMTAKDLSNGSSELEKYIIDWPSEYHLTAKRGQLFAGFDFDPSLKVLEVGCGCGAITRYLGETFSDVVSIEGSINRARLAKLRTKDLSGVSILCAPFQEINFTEKFDIIFCIGVYEYSSAFVDGSTPYDTVLNYFSDILTPNGIVVIAIENQFGLKYFNTAREDHTRELYEGLEGYHVHGDRVKTFGKVELENNLKKYFKNIEFYYPYPDYKLPECIVSDNFLNSSRAGELVSQIRSRDYYGEIPSLWDESLVSLEIAKNKMLPFFANSFLVFAGKTEIMGVSFDQMAVMRTSQRSEKFRTQTCIYEDTNGKLIVAKKALSGDSIATNGKLDLVESNSFWQDSPSLQTVLYNNSLSTSMDIIEMFLPSKIWLEFLENKSESVNSVKYLEGKYIDCIWGNFYHQSNDDFIIDHEWVWKEKIKFNTIVVRAIFYFLERLHDTSNISKVLKVRSRKKMIMVISESIGVKLDNNDISEFIEFESYFQSLVYGSEKNLIMSSLQRALFATPLFYFFRDIKIKIMRVFFQKNLIVRAFNLLKRIFKSFY